MIDSLSLHFFFSFLSFLQHSIDGIGIGFYTNSLSSLDPNFTGVQPALYKNVRPPLNDSNLLSLAANIESKVIFGHIRMAESTVVDVNNHPFKFGASIHAFLLQTFLFKLMLTCFGEFISLRPMDLPTQWISRKHQGYPSVHDQPGL